MKKILLNILGLVIAVVAWIVAYLAIYWSVTLLSSIPLIGTILYLPSDSSWIRTVSALTGGIFAGAFCSTKIAGNAKAFCVLIIALHAFSIARALMMSSLGLGVLLECAIAIGASAICFTMRKQDI